MMKKILITDELSEDGLRILRECSSISVDTLYGLKEDQIIKIIPNYDALIVRSATQVTKAIIDNATRLEIIGRAGVGTDNIDVSAATKKGIIVMNVPGGNTIAAAEHTFGLMLACARFIPQAVYKLKQGIWDRKSFIGVELNNKTLGIIGLGKIGKEVAKRAKAFGMEVISYDPYLLPEQAHKIGVRLVNLEELLRKSHFITLHLPLSEETRNLISWEEFKMMLDGVIIINCARGGIINEEALYEALKSKKVKACGLDVYEQEPPLDSPLLKLDNCLTTPHLGASTREAQINVGVEIAHQIIDAFTKKIIRNAVNIPYIPPELMNILKPYLELGEKIGMLQGQLLTGRINDVYVEYSGEISDYDTKPLTIAVLKGLLSVILDKELINYVNAEALAQERGIRIAEVKSTRPKDYLNTITTKITFDNKQRTVMGAVKEGNNIRIVKIDNFSIDAVPKGCLLIITQTDQPGIIGKIGTILGNLGINIGWLQLSRTKVGEDALSVWNVDDIVPQEALEKIKTIKEVLDVKMVNYEF